MPAKNEHVAKWRAAHHAALESLFGTDKGSGLGLWRKLVRIEREAHRAAENYCNGAIFSDEWEDIRERVAVKVENQLGKLPEGFFINGDPRGYALKVESEVAKRFPGLHRDWGGYGCLAAQIDG